MRLNAVQVTVEALDVRNVEVAAGTLVTVGDVFYDEKLAALMLPELRRLAAAGAEVLVGDPHRAYLPAATLEPVASYDVDVETDLEDAPVKQSLVARLVG
jgi:predicted nicotinamide N-methyase